MNLLPISKIQVNHGKIKEIDRQLKSIYRLIIYSRTHSDDDLLDAYMDGMHNLKQLVSIKNAQMESQNESEAEEYLQHLIKTLDFVVDEIKSNINFESQLQLFQLLRLVSPETNALHANRYRHGIVQIGAHVCPLPEEVPYLVSDLFYQIKETTNPIIRAIYFHHELIRIHPFSDGNGRVTRVAKNWMLMYDLYPPIYINDAFEKKEYVIALSNSFKQLDKKPFTWNSDTEIFFEQEIDRILVNVNWLYETVNQKGTERSKLNIQLK